MVSATALTQQPALEAGLPDWFEHNRVQAHNEHPIQIAAEAGPRIHAVIESVGAKVLTRIVLNRDEGAWWPSAVGETHELTAGRDLAKELIDDLHQREMACIGYFRHMSDMYVQTHHPDWICRDHLGSPVREPRARRARHPVYVICVNSPYRQYIKTRLVELARRNIDIIYFDSWHMPPVCTCPHCRKAFEMETGKPFPFPERSRAAALSGAGIRDDFESYPVGRPIGAAALPEHTPDYLAVSDFVSRSLISAFGEWRRAVTAVNPEVRFAIGSSLYPVFTRQPHLTDRFVALADTSKTEFHKPFGGSMDAIRPIGDVAPPAFDLQTALGWSWVRDCCSGRPPLMWIPFIRREKEALYSSAAAVSYGCIASVHLRVFDRRKKDTVPAADLQALFASSFRNGKLLSPWLAHTRPYGWAALHISQHTRNRLLDDESALWEDVYGPLLGAFETLKDIHVPTVTVSDYLLSNGIPDTVRVLIVPTANDLTAQQRESILRAGRSGTAVIPLETGRQWCLKSTKPAAKKALLAQLEPHLRGLPIRITGPPAMHVNVFRHPVDRHIALTLMNSWGWYRSSRSADEMAPDFIGNAVEPPPIERVTVTIRNDWFRPIHALAALTGRNLKVHSAGGETTLTVPDFQINRCIVMREAPEP